LKKLAAVLVRPSKPQLASTAIRAVH
jgi:hypothetical protein